MKKYLLLILVFSLSLEKLQSQILDFGEFNEDALKSEGFQKLKDYIGDTRIVIIGEQEHGIGSHYENFKLLSQFLHEDLGFNIIIQEYCFFEFYRVNEGLKVLPNAESYRKGMYWPQGKAKEYSAFFNYLNQESKGENPIQMLGADPRIFPRNDFMAYLKKDLDSNIISIHEQARFLSILNILFNQEYRDSTNTSLDKKFFFKTCKSLKYQYQMSRGKETKWKVRFIHNLEVFAKNAWTREFGDLNSPDRFFHREKGMADNIIWLAKEIFPNQKILIHLHNGHMAKNTDLLKFSLDSIQLKKLPNAGSILNEEFGDNCLHFASSYYEGSYCKWDYKELKIPLPPSESIESKMNGLGINYGFYTLNENNQELEKMFYCDFNTWIKNSEPRFPVNQLFDGIIFVNKVKMPMEMENQ